MIAGLAEGLDDDPVATVQELLGTSSYTPASPTYLKSWHMRRIAGVPPHVLRETGSALFAGQRRSLPLAVRGIPAEAKMSGARHLRGTGTSRPRGRPPHPSAVESDGMGRVRVTGSTRNDPMSSITSSRAGSLRSARQLPPEDEGMARHQLQSIWTMESAVRSSLHGVPVSADLGP